MPTFIHWFRRDLRLHDNPALAAALHDSGGRVVPLFVLDQAVLSAERTGAARVMFMLETLRALDRSLRERGSRLIVRHGRPAEVIPQVIAESGAAGVYWNRDYTPFARTRDSRVAELLREHGIPGRTWKEAVIWESGEIMTGSRKPYTVYTPYWRRWRTAVEDARAALTAEEPLLPFARVADAIRSTPIPHAAELGFVTSQAIPPAGEDAALVRLIAFTRSESAHGIGGYAEGRNILALPATSRLSPYLRLGCLGPRTCLRAALHASERIADEQYQRSTETWLGELAWRDFYYQVLAEFPFVLRGCFKREYDQLAWENNEEFFDAWCRGHTGYPIVDAAMRQLQREAWMHNRARMIVASFLTKDLLIDWRWGDRFFMQQLVDGDHASNNGGWQWAAGTGTDAQPYFRIFNPINQGEKFDPDGAYVRRYVPELARVPNRYIHSPWLMSLDEQRRAGVRIGHDYPAPIVDHATQRTRAIALYRSVARGMGDR